MYGMSYFWCDFISPPFVLMLNGLSNYCMFNTYFGLQKTVSVESLSNRISSFIFAACMDEQCNPIQPITISSFLLDKMLPLVLLSSSFLYCTCCWALFISPNIFESSPYLCSQDICALVFHNSNTSLPFGQKKIDWFLILVFPPCSCLIFDAYDPVSYVYLCQIYDCLTLCSSQQHF